MAGSPRWRAFNNYSPGAITCRRIVLLDSTGLLCAYIVASVHTKKRINDHGEVDKAREDHIQFVITGKELAKTLQA